VSLVPAAQPSPGLGAARPGGGVQPSTRSGTPSVPGSGGGRTSTYGSTGGDLAVRCVDDRVRGWAMWPADGWRAEATPAAGGGLTGLFVAADAPMLRVEVTCRNGEALFSPAPPSRPAPRG
jgi:hypothetical protein